MRGTLSCALACSLGIAFYGCVLPGFQNVEREPEGAGSGGASSESASIVSSGTGGATGTVGGSGSGGTEDADAGSGSDAGSPGDCPRNQPYGACDVEGLCPYPRTETFCACYGPGSNWLCEACPRAQPWTGGLCQVQGMACGYSEPTPSSCYCMEDPGGLHWLCA